MCGITTLAGGSSHLADELAVIGIAVRDMYEQNLPCTCEVDVSGYLERIRQAHVRMLDAILHEVGDMLRAVDAGVCKFAER